MPINDNLEAMAKQLYDYWFVQFDFPNEEGKPYKSNGGVMVWNEKLKREIPQGWDISDVKSLIEPIERGVSYSSDEILDMSATPMINLACFSKAGDYRLGEMKFFSGNIPETKLISPMDMLIACTDMTQGADIIGRPILASNEFDQYTFSTDLALVIPKGKLKMYLYYTLRTPFYHKYIRPFASGTTVKHLNLIGVENYVLPIPPMGIQSKFEDTISPIKEQQSKNLNEIVALTKQRDELLPLLMNGQASVNYHLEAMAKQLYDYWFVQFDFPNEEGKPYKSSGGAMVYNERLKREIPVGWQVENLIDFAEIKNGATPSTTDDANYGGDIVWITPKDLSDQQSKFVYQGERNITKQGFDSCSTSMLPINSVLMSSRAPIGLVSIAKHEVCTNQGFKSFIPKNIENSIYLYYYIKHHIKQIEQLGTGTTFKEVSRDDLCKFPILVVGANEAYKQWIELQDKIANKQFVLTKEIAALTKQRDELLPLLMNGQASVNYHLSAC